MSQYQAFGNITNNLNNNNNGKSIPYANGSSNSNSGTQSKSHSAVKGFPFLKNLNHSHDPNQNNTANGYLYNNNNHGSNKDSHQIQIQNQKGTKQHSKSKSKKQDQVQAENTNSYRSNNDHDHYSVHSGSSFDDIFKNRLPQGTFDERIMVEDWLQKRSNSIQMVWKRRWCILRDDYLVYYRSNTDTKPLGALHLSEFSVLTSGSDISKKSKHSFRLSSKSNDSIEHLFHTETHQALDLWKDAIQSHIDHAIRSSNASGTFDPDPGRDRPGYRRSMSLTNDPFQPSGEQSIIDKVLDRLHLEDPTLSDMNDPSTLIIPPPDHLLFQSPQQVYSTNPHLKLDNTLDGWSPSRSTALFSSSNTSASTDASMSVEALQKSANESSSSQQSPIVIRRGNHGTFNSSGSHSQSSTSSFNDIHSSYSSYSEVSQNGNGRGSIQILDHQGRNGSQQSRGNHGQLSTSSTSGSQQQQHLYHTQNGPPSPSLAMYNNNFGTASSPMASPRLLLSNFPSGSTSTGVHPLNAVAPQSQELKRTESSGSSASVSTISLATSDTVGPFETVIEGGLKMTPIELDSKINKDIASIRGTGKTTVRTQHCCTENDLSPLEISEKELKAALANEGKKTKKLWSVYGNSGPSSSNEKAANSSSKKSNGQSQESNNSVFKNLVLVSMPSKKHSNNNTTTKGFSKSMISLPRASESDAHYIPNTAISPSGNGNFFTLSDGSPIHRERSPSVSALDEALLSNSRENSNYPPSVENIISSRPRNTIDPYSQNILKGYIDLYGWSPQQKKQSKSTASQKQTISAITMDWSSSSRNSTIQPQPLRCVDPELHQNHIYYTNARGSVKPVGAESVSRHIVAPDELAMAMTVDQEAEGKRQQEAMDRKTIAKEANLRLVSFLNSPPLTSTSERNVEFSKPHSLTIATAHPESKAAVAEAIPKLTDANILQDIDNDEETNHSRLKVTTTAAWSTPPPKRANESTTLDPSKQKPSRSSLPPLPRKSEGDSELDQSPGIKSEIIQYNPKDHTETQGTHELPLSATEMMSEEGGRRHQGVSRDTPVSLASPTSPPVLPRRSPFRTAPVPTMNAIVPNTQ